MVDMVMGRTRRHELRAVALLLLAGCSGVLRVQEISVGLSMGRSKAATTATGVQASSSVRGVEILQAAPAAFWSMLSSMWQGGGAKGIGEADGGATRADMLAAAESDPALAAQLADAYRLWKTQRAIESLKETK